MRIRGWPIGTGLRNQDAGFVLLLNICYYYSEAKFQTFAQCQKPVGGLFIFPLVASVDILACIRGHPKKGKKGSRIFISSFKSWMHLANQILVVVIIIHERVMQKGCSTPEKAKPEL